MGWLSVWVRQVGLFVFLAALVQLILPPSSERQAARLVIGLVIILKIIEPVGGWIAQSRNGISWNVEMYFPRGEAYIEQGQLLAQETMARVKHTEQRKVLDQLGAMITLTQGVDQAAVSLVQDPKDDGPWHVRVHLIATSNSQGPSEGENLAQAPWDEVSHARVEDTVREFLLKFLPQMSRVDIVWDHIAGR